MTAGYNTLLSQGANLAQSRRTEELSRVYVSAPTGLYLRRKYAPGLVEMQAKVQAWATAIPSLSYARDAAVAAAKDFIVR